MRALKLSLIATLIATAGGFWGGELGIMQKMWPEHPGLAGFFITLVTCFIVQLLWPKEWLGGQRNKT